jgi:ribonuclease BN (tRNA processing enzyme)
MNRSDLDLYKNMDVLICETFCLENQKEELEPHEKSHITAKET